MIKRMAAMVCVLALVGIAPVHASIDAAGTTAGNFLSVGAGASALGMAGATLALPMGIIGSAWNPAALARLDETELAFSHAGLENQTSQEWVAVGGRFANTSTHWAVSGLYNGQGSFEGRDATGLSTGSFGVTDMALGVHVARQFGPVVSAGLGAKYVSEVLDAVSGSGLTFDGGVQVRAGMAGLGIAAQNLGGRMNYGGASFPLPTNYGVGAALDLPSGMRLALDANFPKAYYNDVRAGVEWRYHGVLALRAGYRKELAAASDDRLTGPTFGLGGGVGSMWFDYGYIIPGQGDGEHRFGLTMHPGAMRAIMRPMADGKPAESAPVAAQTPAEKPAKPAKASKAAKTPPADTTPLATTAPAKPAKHAKSQGAAASGLLSAAEAAALAPSTPKPSVPAPVAVTPPRAVPAPAAANTPAPVAVTPQPVTPAPAAVSPTPRSAPVAVSPTSKSAPVAVAPAPKPAAPSVPAAASQVASALVPVAAPRTIKPTAPAPTAVQQPLEAPKPALPQPAETAPAPLPAPVAVVPAAKPAAVTVSVHAAAYAGDHAGRGAGRDPAPGQGEGALGRDPRFDRQAVGHEQGRDHDGEQHGHRQGQARPDAQDAQEVVRTPPRKAEQARARCPEPGSSRWGRGVARARSRGRPSHAARRRNASAARRARAGTRPRRAGPRPSPPRNGAALRGAAAPGRRRRRTGSRSAAVRAPRPR